MEITNTRYHNCIYCVVGEVWSVLGLFAQFHDFLSLKPSEDVSTSLQSKYKISVGTYNMSVSEFRDRVLTVHFLRSSLLKSLND